ncbi:MAG: hypothetical protein LQ340_007326 [Diploschistes diacapsis]|nr:MAG: hypothetical protein LQ340_007326 [Diploschistes diacapsis]
MRRFSYLQNVTTPLLRSTRQPIPRSTALQQSRFYSSAPSARSSKRTFPLWFVVGALSGVLITFAWATAKPQVNQLAEGLNATSFTSYRLVDREPVSSTSSIFTFVPLQRGRDASLLNKLYLQGLWSSEIKQPQLQVSRYYTPLGLSAVNKGRYGEDALQFLIREELHGEVSGWLHRLPLGTSVGLRGPRGQYTLPNDTKEMVYLAGGTGIAPAIQAARSLLINTESRDALPQFHIMWANRRREDCMGGINDSRSSSGWFSWLSSNRAPSFAQQQQSRQSVLVEELESLKSAFCGKMKVDYFVDDEKSFITWDALKPALDTTEVSGARSNTANVQNRLILVSGPDGFIAHYAGPKAWVEGNETQGELGGLLRHVEKLGWKVAKI